MEKIQAAGTSGGGWVYTHQVRKAKTEIPVKSRYVKSLAPKDWETSEYVCAENNRDLVQMGGK